MRAEHILAFAGLASAAPTFLDKRQLGGFGGLGGGRGGSTSNELEQGQCRDVTFIMARASTEPGNMGGSTGPATCSGLKRSLGEQAVACQGVGGPYTAGLGDNARPRGTSPAAIQEATRLIDLAATKCPNTAIVVGGYSQGTAVMHAAVGDLPAQTKDRVVGAVMYGDTRNQQDRGQIPNYPRERTRIYCEAGDGVCRGTLAVSAAHFAYADDVAPAVQFLTQRIQAGGEGGGSVPPGGGSGSGNATDGGESGSGAGGSTGGGLGSRLGGGGRSGLGGGGLGGGSGGLGSRLGGGSGGLRSLFGGGSSGGGLGGFGGGSSSGRLGGIGSLGGGGGGLSSLFGGGGLGGSRK